MNKGYGVLGQEHSLSLQDEINNRLDSMRREAEARGEDFYSPVLAMGISERVGSNWFSDTLRSLMPQHNEPFRQQLHPTQRLSSLNPDLISIEELNRRQLAPFEQHWLVSYVVSKYGQPRQLTKETNLLFATDNYLKLFPDSPVIVLSRNPLGIASSFESRGLFNKWGYEARYKQMRSMTERPEFADYRFIVEPEGSDSLQKLGRLIILNTLLLSEGLEARDFAHVSYETAFSSQLSALKTVSLLLFGESGLIDAKTLLDQASEDSSGDNTFSTKQPKNELVAYLDNEESEKLSEEIEVVMNQAGDFMPSSVIERTRLFLGTDGQAYALAGSQSPKKSKKKEGFDQEINVETQFIEIDGQPLLYRNTLVTNEEFCQFINLLHSAGLNNLVNGTHLLFNESMLKERGGRVHFDNASESYIVDAGYNNQPVYWVTWIGAMAFALSQGARLPTRNEMDNLVKSLPIDLDSLNGDYRIGDASQVTETGKSEAAIHHPLGNVMIWCDDGPPNESSFRPMEKYFYGIAWNTPATLEEANNAKVRHITGSSRGIGIRLVKDIDKMRPPQDVNTIASKIESALAELRNRNKTLADIEKGFLGHFI